MRYALAFFLLVVPAAAKDSCGECHSDQAAVFKDDVHSQRGFGCASCHGGDPNADDQDAAMNRARGFKGKVARAAVPQLCAHCHSDAALIHKFKPQQRVDQLAQYQTSRHGQRLAKGDTNVANCVDCHGVHNIREVRHPLSPVHPLKLPDTCGRCHKDRALMAKYNIQATEFEEYRKSVHWDALAKRGDLSAPSCASCHGNHGATPPQVSSVAAVCGTCHVLLEDLYKKSPHQPVFAREGKGGCIVCHNKHEILRPTPALLAGCGQCHRDACVNAAAAMKAEIDGLNQALHRSDEILARARRSGMEVSEALMRQVEGRESLVKTRVAVHAFNLGTLMEPVKKGLDIAAETHQAGQAALKERDFRRFGLGVALTAILITMAGLWLAIRRIESKRPQDAA